jgi:hypothetical protein
VRSGWPVARHTVLVTPYALEEWPTRHFDALYHVGTMVGGDKGTWSLEGDGLSVSLHPEAWEEIAELGGRAWWELTKSGNRFLDAHALRTSQQEAIVTWGKAQGYLEAVTRFRVRWYDEMVRDTIWMDLENLEDAEEESRETGAAIEEVMVVVAGTRWPDIAGRANADQVVLALFADEVLGIDGVWWEDNFNVEELSCPRGVISVRSLTTWQVSELVRQ